MRDQVSRDEKTVRIFSAVLIFTVVLVVGGGAVALLQAAVGLPEGLVQPVFAAVLAVAVGLAVASLTCRTDHGPDPG